MENRVIVHENSGSPADQAILLSTGGERGLPASALWEYSLLSFDDAFLWNLYSPYGFSKLSRPDSIRMAYERIILMVDQPELSAP
jgi:hypothetical protein